LRRKRGFLELPKERVVRGEYSKFLERIGRSWQQSWKETRVDCLVVHLKNIPTLKQGNQVNGVPSRIYMLYDCFVL